MSKNNHNIKTQIEPSDEKIIKKTEQNTERSNSEPENQKHNSGKTKNKKRHNTLYVIMSVIAVLLIFGGVFMLSEYQLDSIKLPDSLSEIKSSVYMILNGGKDLSVRQADDEQLAIPKVKLYSQEGRAVEPDKITSANLKSGAGEFNTSGGTKALYDGDPNTCMENEGEDNWVTLDAGELKSLSYIKYIPNTSSQMTANMCVGTKFLASKDNKNFVELGTVNPDINGDLSADWHIMEFSGYGEYRYFKIELSAFASFGEIEWICNNGIMVDSADTTTIDLVAYDPIENFSGLVTLAVYNKDKLLKSYKTIDAEFLIGEYTPIEFSGMKLQLGDYIRILTYDRNTMETAVNLPLDYRYTEASSSLSMANVYSDNMMFQADEELVIYGKAPRGTTVTAELKDNATGEVFKNSAGSDNSWEISLGCFGNGGSYSLTVTDGEDKLEFDNITFGDVWVFAGQSNMEFYLCGEKSGEQLLNSGAGKRRATSSDIRMVNMYNIGINGANGEIENVPLNDWNEYWTELTPDRASYISAIAYYFAQGLKEKYNRNVGIISVAVGDTEINRWYPNGMSNGSFTGDGGDLYNNRIYPFTKFKVSGILWYQGEADQYRTNMTAEQYSDAMAGLIDVYREKWNKSDLPFYYAQVTRYGVKDESEIREGQRIALNKIKNKNNVGMVGLLDIIGAYEQGSGCARTDIHPWQKEVVAQRFLNYAARDLYGEEDIVVSGPEYESKQIEGNTAVLSFKHSGSLRVMDKSQYADSACDSKIKATGTDTSVLHEFWVSDESGKFYPANAEIADDKVIVWSEAVQNPVDVMYAWGAYPEMPNLTDDSGLPASTFNTKNGSSVIN